MDRHLRESWTHSTEVASLSYTHCRHFSRLKPDQAALAGLVHEIGRLPLLVWVDENEVEGAMLSLLLQEAHAEVGVEILTNWDFPAVLRSVPIGRLISTDRFLMRTTLTWSRWRVFTALLVPATILRPRTGMP